MHPIRQSQLTGRLRLAHARETHEAKTQDMDEQRRRFLALDDPGAAARAVSAFNLFQTPPDIAERMVEILDYQGGRVLEPSAGLGRLYAAVRRTSDDCPVVLVENAPACCAELYRTIDGDSAARLIQGDFLAKSAADLGGTFERVVMNPPFKMGTDVRHITHALKLLADGGRLVALCFGGSRQERALRPLADHWERLPSGSFASEGTRADVVLCSFCSTRRA